MLSPPAKKIPMSYTYIASESLGVLSSEEVMPGTLFTLCQRTPYACLVPLAYDICEQILCLWICKPASSVISSALHVGSRVSYVGRLVSVSYYDLTSRWRMVSV